MRVQRDEITTVEASGLALPELISVGPDDGRVGGDFTERRVACSGVTRLRGECRKQIAGSGKDRTPLCS